MSHTVAPSINCPPKDVSCITGKLRAIRAFSTKPNAGIASLFSTPPTLWAHLDIADGVFTPHRTWRNVFEWPELPERIKLEVHLMMQDPISESNAWIKAGANRLIVHAETVNPHLLEVLVALAEEQGVEVMLSTNPETRLAEVEEMLSLVRAHQVLTVHPGLSGQAFLPEALKKVTLLRERYPGATIEVDGGINKKTAVTALDAGADILVSSSYIWQSEDSGRAYRELVDL